MSTGWSKVESGTNHPRPQPGLSLVTAPAALPGTVSAAADAALARSKSEFPGSTVASDTGQDRPTGQCQTAIPYHSRPPGWPRWPQRGAWRLKLRSDAAISCQWCSSVSSLAQQAKHRCYVINVCAVEMLFRLRRPQPPTLHVCACLCVSLAPSPSTALVHGLLEMAAPGKQQVVICHLVSRSSHAVAISKQRTYPRVNSQKLD